VLNGRSTLAGSSRRDFARFEWNSLPIEPGRAPDRQWYYIRVVDLDQQFLDGTKNIDA
jgi:hypothetical protein